MQINYRKIMPILVLAFSLLVLSPSYAIARETTGQASFDLNSLTPQSQVVTLSDGTTGELGIIPSNGPVPYGTISLGNGNGTWTVYWNTGMLNTSYKINVSSYRITRAYEPITSTVGAVVDGVSLTRTSTTSTMTTRYHEILTPLQASDTRILRGNISGTNLVTSVSTSLG